MAEVYGVLAERGDGKSNFLTAIGWISLYKENRPVNIDYEVTYPATFMSFSKMMQTWRKAKPRTVWIIDEMGQNADAYDFFKKEPREASAFLEQIRHLRGKFYFGIQRRWLTTFRIRELVDYWFMPQDLDRYEFDHNEPENFGRCAGLFKITLVDKYFITVGTRYFDGKPYRDMYNTYRILEDKANVKS